MSEIQTAPTETEDLLVGESIFGLTLLHSLINSRWVLWSVAITVILLLIKLLRNRSEQKLSRKVVPSLTRRRTRRPLNGDKQKQNHNASQLSLDTSSNTSSSSHPPLGDAPDGIPPSSSAGGDDTSSPNSSSSNSTSPNGKQRPIFVTKAGWLRKKGRAFPYTWKRRYCILHECTLTYHISEEAAANNETKGSVECQSGQVEKIGSDINGFLIVTEGRTLRLQADSFASALSWIGAISSNIHTYKLQQVQRANQARRASGGGDSASTTSISSSLSSLSPSSSEQHAPSTATHLPPHALSKRHTVTHHEEPSSPSSPSSTSKE